MKRDVQSPKASRTSPSPAITGNSRNHTRRGILCVNEQSTGTEVRFAGGLLWFDLILRNTREDNLMSAEQLVRRLIRHEECEWIEYKHNQDRPETIGEYVSALANGAALNTQQFGYLIWGIEDGSKNIVGTTVNPSKVVENKDFRLYLQLYTNPRLHLEFGEVVLDGHRVVFMKVPAAKLYPVDFKGKRFIRIESSKTELRTFLGTEAALWKVLFAQEERDKALVADLTRTGSLKKPASLRAIAEWCKWEVDAHHLLSCIEDDLGPYLEHFARVPERQRSLLGAIAERIYDRGARHRPKLDVDEIEAMTGLSRSKTTRELKLLETLDMGYVDPSYTPPIFFLAGCYSGWELWMDLVPFTRSRGHSLEVLWKDLDFTILD